MPTKLIPAVAWFALLPAVLGDLCVEAAEDVGADDAPRLITLRLGNFDRWVYGGNGPEAVAAARNRMESILQGRLKAVDQVCALTDVQTEKLQLAGRGDISRYFQHAGQTRQSFAAIDELTPAVTNALNHEARRLHGIGSAGPFYGGSLFGKMARRLLTHEQYVAFEALCEIEQAGGTVFAAERGNEKLLRIRLTGTAFSDAGMAHLDELVNVELLALNGTNVTNAGLVHLRNFGRLQQLDLCETAVADHGLAHLADLTNLEVL